MISKKDLLKKMNISYGQLYRWKREELIPDEWFNKVSVSSGQETYFNEEDIIPRITKILELKDQYSLEEIRNMLCSKCNKQYITKKNLYDFIDTDILDNATEFLEGDISNYTASVLYAFHLFKQINLKVNFKNYIKCVLTQQEFKTDNCLLVLEYEKKEVINVGIFHKPAFMYGTVDVWSIDLNESFNQLIAKINM